MKPRIVNLLDERSLREYRKGSDYGPVTFRLSQKVFRQMLKAAPNYKEWLYEEMAEMLGKMLLENGTIRVLEEPIHDSLQRKIGKQFHMEIDVYCEPEVLENE